MKTPTEDQHEYEDTKTTMLQHSENLKITKDNDIEDIE